MSQILDAIVVTRRGPTVQEEVAEKFVRLSDELWSKYAEALCLSETPAFEQTWIATVNVPSAGFRGPPIQTLRSTVASSDFPTLCLDDASALAAGRHLQFADAAALAHHEIREFRDYLKARRQLALSVRTRATSETSTLVSFFQPASAARLPLAEKRALLHRTEWSDDKNRRRCELVDKEIDGQLSAAEKRELEDLQAQMLAYRRKIAPLPIAELRELHRELLDKASGHST
jgi:hypothetical protein